MMTIAELDERASWLGIGPRDRTALADYVTHVRAAKIRAYRPSVTELRGTAGSSKWHVKFGRLYVVPSMTAGARKLMSVWEFTRKYTLKKQGREVLKVPAAGFFDKARADGLTAEKGMPELVSKAIGERLDELDRELRALHADFVSRARDVYDDHIGSPRRRQGAVNGLRRALSRNPGIRKLDPSLLVRILSMDEKSLQTLLELSRQSDSSFVDEGAVREAFALFDARTVLES